MKHHTIPISEPGKGVSPRMLAGAVVFAYNQGWKDKEDLFVVNTPYDTDVIEMVLEVLE